MAPSHCVLLAFLSVVLLVVQAWVIPDEPETRITGGKEIEYSEAPWMGHLTMYNPETKITSQCGGSIIHKNWFLTAAHCTYPYEKQNLKIRIGSKSCITGGKFYYVKEVVNHEKYNNETLLNDISLIETLDPIPLGTLMRPIKLPGQGSRATIGKEVTVTGWGAMEDEKPSLSLRAVTIKTLPISDCEHLSAFIDASTQLCAGLSGKNSCPGDSGGPLVDGDVIVGIVSYGTNETCALRPSVYTDVGVYVRWITEHAPM